MKKVFFAGVFISVLSALWGFWLEPSKITYKEENIKISNLPKELNGLKILFITDLHAGSPYIDLDAIKNIVDTSNSYNPDIILLGGDYLFSGSLLFGNLGGEYISEDEIFSELNNLKASLGVYAVMGNHDWGYGYKKVVSHFNKHANKINLLEDRAVTLTYNSKELLLAGITDYWKGQQNYKKMISDNEDKYIIALTHNADVFPELPSSISLLFAGHTHGGQAYIPFVGRPATPSKYGDKYAVGLFKEDNKTMFVSAGIGTTGLGVRFLAAPEVNILTLITD